MSGVKGGWGVFPFFLFFLLTASFSLFAFPAGAEF
jgi:hypothetical protein